MSHDFRDLDLVLARLFAALNVCGAAPYLTGDGVGDDGRPMLRVQARLAGRPSEAELLRVLDAGRRAVREIGVAARFWIEMSRTDADVVEFCFGAAEPAPPSTG